MSAVNTNNPISITHKAQGSTGPKLFSLLTWMLIMIGLGGCDKQGKNKAPVNTVNNNKTTEQTQISKTAVETTNAQSYKVRELKASTGTSNYKQEISEKLTKLQLEAKELKESGNASKESILKFYKRIGSIFPPFYAVRKNLDNSIFQNLKTLIHLIRSNDPSNFSKVNLAINKLQAAVPTKLAA